MADEETLRRQARYLREQIDRAEDSTILNQLWLDFYAIADQLFPEALEKRRLYRSLEGEERRREKVAYAGLVEYLWATLEESSTPPVEVDDLSEISAIDLSVRTASLERESGSTDDSVIRETLATEVECIREELRSRLGESETEEGRDESTETISGIPRPGHAYMDALLNATLFFSSCLFSVIGIGAFLVFVYPKLSAFPAIPGDLKTLLWAALAHFIIFGAFCSYIAKEKGRSSGAWFALGGLFGLLAVLAIGFTPSPKDSAS